MPKNQWLAAMIVVGLLAVGCGDDDDDGPVDAGRDAGEMDAGAMDAGDDDAGADDGGDDDGGDGAVGDGGGDASADGGGTFTSTLALTTAQEVPVCTAAGASAMGTGTVTIDEDDELTVMVTYSGLSGPVTMAHIHIAPPGMAGPIVLPFTDLSSPIMETFTEADYPADPPAEAPETWAEFLDAVRDGDTYVNLHTEACAPGEIRDQIE